MPQTRPSAPPPVEPDDEPMGRVPVVSKKGFDAIVELGKRKKPLPKSMATAMQEYAKIRENQKRR